VTLKAGLGSLKVIGTDTHRSATYAFLLTFLMAGCTNAELIIWLANRGLTLTAQLTRCRVARSTVN